MSQGYVEQNLCDDSHKHKTSLIQVFPQQESSYPVCLNTEYPDACRTPLSRLSGVTKQSDIKKCEDCKSTIIRDKVVSRIQSVCVEDNLREELKQLRDQLTDLKCYTQILQKRNEQIAVCLEKEKLKCNHLQVALSIIKKQDRQLDKRLGQKQQVIVKLCEQLENERNMNERQRQRLDECLAENNYIKQLIMIANGNYESLQVKYRALKDENKRLDEESVKKQKQFTLSIGQMKNVLTELISFPNYNTNTNHCLSFGDNQDNGKKNVFLSANRNNKKQQAEEIYRKMFIKTLKGIK